MPLSQPHMPRSHRARSRSRHAAATAPAAGRRAVRRPSLLPASGRLRPGVVAAVGAAVVTLVIAARAGALTQLWDFLDFGAGVLSLVSLTSTVLWGLVATDRVLLGSGHRLIAQGVHRGLAVSGLGFLALHIWVKVAEAQTTATAAALPFTDVDQPVLIGLGTLAGYLFVSVAVSGALRSVFATKTRSLWWRVLHFGAYPAWGASLVHGLKSGRSASGWVTVAYALCLIGVATLVALRIKSRMDGTGARPPVQPGIAPTRLRQVSFARPRPDRGADGPPRQPSPPPPRPENPPYAATVYIPGQASGAQDVPAERLVTRERWL